MTLYSRHSETKLSDYQVPVHPIVKCSIKGVQVEALADTGSMRSFLNSNIHTIVDFDEIETKKVKNERCVSITGDPLQVKGYLDVGVTIKKVKYKATLLVCDKIPYDCVLGWDFLVQNNLDIRVINSMRNGTYCLVGRHGKTPLTGTVGENTCQEPNPDKVKAVMSFSEPQTVKEVRSFLGLAGYYRRFYSRFATIAAPLTELTKTGKVFKWSETRAQSFVTLTNLLCSAPILMYPNFDREFILYTDASDVSVGAVLSQIDDNGKERIVAYASQSLSEGERRYSTTGKEAFAIVYATRHFRVYLLGRPFTVVTGHNALRWLHSIMTQRN